MRNTAFVSIVIVIVAGGLLVGWNAEKVLAALAMRHGRQASAGLVRQPYDFNVDTTMLNGPAQVPDTPAFRRLWARQAVGPCAMPPPGDEAEVVLFGVYEGQAVSSASVAGMDRRTGVVDIEIEPGATPLYLVMSSYEPMIWRFSGATQRVRRVALSTQGRSTAGKPYAGATGLSADQVGFATGVGCMGYFSEPGSFRAQQVAEAVKRYTGRTPTIVGGHYGLVAARLPSGRGADLGQGRRRGRLAPSDVDALSGVLVRIDPEQVISAQKVEPYDVLPGQAGLAQLVADGSLRREGGNGFTIVKPIARYPADLNGGHAVVFRLGDGVPRPGGSPGHSCVYGPGQSRGEGAIC